LKYWPGLKPQLLWSQPLKLLRLLAWASGTWPFLCFFERRSCYAAQADLELPESTDSPSLAFHVVRTVGVHH
jgi:hypothetical protein